MMARPLRMIQMTDMHLFKDSNKALLGVKTQESFNAIVKHLQHEEQEADLIILSGDLSQDGSLESYRYLIHTFMPFTIPIYALPGNHDHPHLLTQCCTETEGPITCQQTVFVRNWQLILLNSQMPGKVSGQLDLSQLNHLTHCLKQNHHLHTLAILHHHPVSVGSVWLDQIGLKNAEQFWDCLHGFPPIKGVVFGHVHQAYTGLVDETPCYGAPSTCIQFKPQEACFKLENVPPGYRWFNLYEDGRLETGIVRLPGYIGFFDIHAKGY